MSRLIAHPGFPFSSKCEDISIVVQNEIKRMSLQFLRSFQDVLSLFSVQNCKLLVIINTSK